LRRTKRAIKSKSPPKITLKRKRCPNGSRRNKITGDCDKKHKTVVERTIEIVRTPVAVKRCPNGSRRNKITGDCDKNKTVIERIVGIFPIPVAVKRCPNGSRKNKITGKCDPK
jgi:hypothetical protein